jgi:hypothetical protein
MSMFESHSPAMKYPLNRLQLEIVVFSSFETNFVSLFLSLRSEIFF